MNPEEAQQLQAHIQGIAQILYRNTPDTDLTSLEAIEKSVRQQMLEHVSPQVVFFLSSKSLGRLCSWLLEQQVYFCLRLKQNEFVQLEGEIWLQLEQLGLVPGMQLYSNPK